MEHAPFECGRCGVHLPLKRDLAAEPDEVQWACLNCGWQMSGILDPAARASIAYNVAAVVCLPARVEFPAVKIRRVEYRHPAEPSLQNFIGRYFSRAAYRA